MAGKRKGMPSNHRPTSHDDQRGLGQGPGPAEDAVERVVSRACGGDEDAWRWIVDAYAKRVYGLLRSKGCDRARAEEITQSVFVSVARVLGQGQYKEQGHFDAWLLRIAMNRLRDDARARKRRPMQAYDESSVHLTGEHRPDNGAPQDGLAGLDQLHEALADLSPPDREVIELRHRADMSFKQIADLLGQPLGTVLARHHRALRKLKTALEAAGVSRSGAPGA